MRRYQPTSLPALADALAAGTFGPDDDLVEAASESEDDEYAALMTAADLSAARLAGLPAGRRRRVVVVMESSSSDIVAVHVHVHVDADDDAGPDDDLAWYATQELDSLLGFD